MVAQGEKASGAVDYDFLAFVTLKETSACTGQTQAIPTSYGWLNDAILIWLYPIARSSQDHDGHRPELQLASWILVLAAKIC